MFSRATIMAGRLWGDNPYGYKMVRDYYAINIDEQSDLAAVSFLYKQLESENRLHLIDAGVL